MEGRNIWNNFLILLLIHHNVCLGIKLTAYLSENGLHGTVDFQEQPKDSKNVYIQVSLQVAEDQSVWSWQIREFPLYYTNLENRCTGNNLGSKLVDLNEIVGPLTFPDNSSSTVILSKDLLSLEGPRGIWGRSLVLHSDDGRRACGSITISGAADEKVAEARFFSPLTGSVFFRWAGSQQLNTIDTLVHVNLYRVSKPSWTLTENTKHNWKIFATDILDSEADKARENCNFLQLVFDPESAPKGQAIGDIDNRLGTLQVAKDFESSVTSVFHDPVLASLPVALLDNRRSLYLVIFDSRHHDSFLGCAKIRELSPITFKTLISSNGIKGQVTFSQRSPFDPTWLQFNLTSPRNEDKRISSFKINELLPLSYVPPGENRCLTTGQLFNPTSISNENAGASQDTYAIGDLSGKHNMWRKELTLSELNQKYWDVFLPLQGPHSIGHRSLVFHRNLGNGTMVPWFCGDLIQYLSSNKNWKMPMFTASVVFRYPTVGRIIFRQPRDQPWTDTTIIIESLVHGDGTNLNNTEDHRWLIHEFPPGKDFYNWTGRCLSAGTPYNPYKVDYDPNNDETCNQFSPSSCRLGDLSGRHGTLKIAGRRVNGTRLTRRLFTDSQLPLSGAASIVGRALVLYDDNGPKARGERLACSPVTAVYRRKAVVKDWFGNGQLTPAPVQANLEFPCEASTLYGHWNPKGVSPRLSPPPTQGSDDEYEMGDLSGKFGLLNNLTSLIAAYNDTDITLFGPSSILGRSVVIHKREKNVRWTCSSIERGYAPSEARELRAIASFHHPLGFAWGYIRMTQLIYNDGSASETILEVNLRHPGKNDRNVTRNHNWAIYVNPVGVDASVKILNTRCVAGGYIWNPYYTQLADPRNDELYREECGPDNPLRCYVGDISGRLGTIDIGVERQVFSDVNFPLEGPVSALGRSIVILNKDRGHERFACANIEPDYDIIKYANLRKPPKFVMAQFIDDVREVMGIPEWMLSVDSRKTKLLHGGGCVQFLMHFKGPVASQLEQDFNRLINIGVLSTPSLYIHGYVPPLKRKTTLPYRPCGSRDPADRKSRNNGGHNFHVHSPTKFLLLVVIFCYFLY
ncbi:Uncharacterized protein GBIM_13929 [Gryllus bimaculatus]|nr:Uncharacterized protein GBIM_13929 [Gryllus bimaculatus]